jgi:hypothetical protein
MSRSESRFLNESSCFDECAYVRRDLHTTRDLGRWCDETLTDEKLQDTRNKLEMDACKASDN